MARINFEDDVEAQDEFWALLPLLGGDRDKALGKLLRFFRMAQKAWGHGVPMTEEELSSKGFRDMIESGWAEPVGGGYHALGAAKHFDWFRQKVEAGQKGGLKKAENRKLATLDTAEATLAPAYPLALAPSPVLAPALTNKTHTQENAASVGELQGQIKEASRAWQDCLKKHGAERVLFPYEHTEIARNIQARGIEAVQLAILGQKYEPESAEFKPSRHLSLKRLFDPQKFDRFVNLGAQARKKLSEREAEQTRLNEMQAIAEEPSADKPEDVRAYLDQFLGKKAGA